MEEKPVSTQIADYTTLAWYKTNSTVFSTIEGHLTVVNDSLSFIDSTGKTVFWFSFNDIQKVRLDPSEFLFNTTSGDYLVSLFNLKKYSAEMAVGGVGGIGMGMRDVNAANQDAIKLENIIKSHGIITYGLKTNVNFANQQRRGLMLYVMYLLLIGLAIFITVRLLNRH